LAWNSRVQKAWFEMEDPPLIAALTSTLHAGTW
jgi:hypothetical protein